MGGTILYSDDSRTDSILLFSSTVTSSLNIARMNRSIVFRRCLKIVSLCVVYCLVSGDSLSAGDVRTWTSKDGKTSFAGEMRGYSPEETEAVISNAEDGKTVRVPIKDLSAADQKHVRAVIERAQRGGGSSEPLVLDPTPPSVEKEGDRWLLKPAISIRLPNGADEWKITSKKPLTRGLSPGIVPGPLEVIENYGDSPWTTMLREILSLTRFSGVV